MPAIRSNRSPIGIMIPNRRRFSVAALAVVCKVAKERLPDGKTNRAMVFSDELNDLSRFEGEGGSATPIPDLVDVPIASAIWRRPRWAAFQANQDKLTP